STSERRLRLLVLEDNIYFINAWKELYEDGEVVAFSSPEKFLNEITDRKGMLREFDVIITDYHFRTSNITGSKLCHEIKTIQPDAIVLLASDDKSIVEAEFDGIIEKRPYDRLELLRLLKTSG